MKIKNLLFAAAALVGFASCSSDDAKTAPVGGEASLLHVSFFIPTQAPSVRSIVEEPVDEIDPVISSAKVYILRGATVVSQKDIVLTSNSGEVTFDNVLIGGDETVVISANADRTELVGLEVKDIQPTGSDKGIKNVYYRSSTALSTADKTVTNNKTTYVLNGVQVSPVAARVELGGNIKFDKTYVTDLTVDIVTPNAYTNKIGDVDYFYPKFSPVGSENPGVLTIQGNDFYDRIKDASTFVVANHLFAGDEQRIAFRINATTYSVLTDDDGKKIVLKGKDGANDYKSYIYQDMQGGLYILPLSEADKIIFNKRTTTPVGSVASGLKKVTRQPNGTYELGEAITNDVSLKTSAEIGATAKNGFYALVRFGTAVNEDLTQVDAGKYVSGSIYKLNFAEVDWNNDGKINDEDVYNPDTNGSGTENPSHKADVVVKATIAKWVLKNVVPGVE